MNSQPLKIEVRSEIGKLNSVLLHKPGAEVENMTPRTVQRALYSDILNLAVAQKEYAELSGILSKVAEVHEVSELLEQVLNKPNAREDLIQRICSTEDVTDYFETLMAMDSKMLATVLIVGLPAKISTLTSYFKNEYYALPPLYNFYFTRDAAVTLGSQVLACRMANRVRMREALIMDAIYRESGEFECKVVDANEFQYDKAGINMEGGDIIVAREDILLLGNGMRTSTQGVDFMIERFRHDCGPGKYNIIVQQLPSEPESFIHLDMTFTFLDKDKCLVFDPLIIESNQYQTVHIVVENNKVKSIRPVAGILPALKNLGMDLKPVICGGDDEWDQEREQWHSGANSFAFAPGKVLTYARNIHTLEQLDKNGFEIVKAADILSGAVSDEILFNDKPVAVAIAGAELARGGGGPRCMTMPLSRQKVEW